MSDIVKFLEASTIFNGLTNEQLRELTGIANEITIQPNDIFIQENELGDAFYILKTGEAEIYRYDEETKENLKIGIAKPGAILGEISLIDHEPRSASVRALCETTLYVFSIGKLKSLKPSTSIFRNLFGRKKDASIYECILQNISRNMAEKLRSSNESIVGALKSELKHAKARIAMGKFTISAISLICLFTYIVQILPLLNINVSSTSIIGAPLLISFAIPLIFMMRFSGYPLSVYGLTTENWREAVTESILFTIPVLAIIVLYKYFLIHFVPYFHDRSLYDMTLDLTAAGETTSISLWHGISIVLLYLLFVPIQELLARGALQSSLEILLISKHKTLLAILASNLMFSTFHLYVSIPFAFAAFLPGIFWGWLYSRQRTLIGVIASHWMIGLWAIFAVGIF